MPIPLSPTTLTSWTRHPAYLSGGFSASLFLVVFLLAWLGFCSGFLHASGYPGGFVWQRSANWVVSGSIPSQSSKNDSQGNTVWNYTCVSGGSFINDAGTDKWWKLARTDLTAGTWGVPVFLYGTKLPYFNQTYLQMYTNDLTIAPLGVWRNPVSAGIYVLVSGSVSWSGPGSGTNTIPVDYILALHRVADKTWQTLDSAVFAPAGTATPTNVRDYSGAQAFAPVAVAPGDEIVWGFKRSANFNNGITWMNMNDKLSFTLVGGDSVGDLTVASPVTGTSSATFTVGLTNSGTTPVSIGYTTADGSALAGTDYVTTSGTLVFAPGVMTQTVSVPIYGNAVPQSNKTFSLMLNNAIGVVLSQPSALCTIVTSALAPPSNFTAMVAGIAGIDLSWNEPAFLPDGYVIQRSVNGGAYQTLATIPSGTGTYRDAAVQPGVSYTYLIISTNAVVSVASGAVSALETSGSNAFPASAFLNTRDYGAMWWRSGVRGERVWQIKTSRYAMTFACDSLNLSTLFPLSTSIPEAEALVQTNSVSFPASAPASSLSCALTASGSTIAINANSTSNDDAHLLECGKFYQRRWQKVKTASGPALSSTQSGVEICAWPDRVSIVYRVVPTSDISGGSLDLTLGFQNIYTILSSIGAANGLAAADGSGFVILKSASSSTIAIDAAASRVTVHTDGGTWLANQECSVGLVIYPSMDVASTVAVASGIESGKLTVSATQVAPSTVALSPHYDLDRGHYRIALRNDASGSDPNRVERTQINVSNTTASPQLARFEFTKDSLPYIQGASCLLRDLDGNPLGIPVQLSKDWHTGNVQRWQGYWFHGLTMFTVPANTTLRFEVLVVGQNYGGVPAASHSQLCLVGYSATGNQQWEESALGCWGETLCHDPESDLANAIGTDSRPLMILSSGTAQKQWTGNYGGCDFLRYYDGSNTRRYQNRIRTWYRCYGPNLTDVTYAGLTDDARIELQYSASLSRSNDYTRGRHHLRCDVISDAAFTRMVFFQLASDNYNYNGGSTHCYGYGDQLTATAQWSGTNITTPVQLTGTLPWLTTLSCPVDTTVPSLTGIMRGFIIRSWKARINGQDNVSPYFVSSGSRFDLAPPPGVTTLKAGDYVEAEIERIYIPQSATSYYGGDANLVAALQNYGNTGQMTLREAIGNNLAVAVTSGSLEKSYPIQIRTVNNTAEFSVSRGIGYVPMTFTGLTDYRKPLLEELVGSTWVALNQATAGNDFWQVDFEPVSASWQITYNVKLDAAYQDLAGLRDAPVSRTFRFRQNGAPSAAVSAPGAAIPGALSQTSIALVAGDTPVSGVTVSAVSSDDALTSNASLIVAGSGSNRTLSYLPNAGQKGTVTITLFITDSEGKTTAQSFPVTIDASQAWKQKYLSGVTDPNVTGDAFDPDGDGMTNLQEYAAGTNPLNSSDRFTTNLARSGIGIDAGVSGRAGRVYVLDRCMNLSQGSWQEITRTGTLPADQFLILNDPAPPSEAGFYRIRAIAPSP